MSEELQHAVGVEDVTTAKLHASLIFELASEADVAKLVTAWKSRAGADAIRLKAWQAVGFSSNAVALVSTAQFLDTLTNDLLAIDHLGLVGQLVCASLDLRAH